MMAVALYFRFERARMALSRIIPLLTNPNVPLPQLAPDPTVGASGFSMDRLDEQRHIAHSPHALVGHFRPMQVLLKSSGTDIQNRALYRDRPVTAVSLNKGVLHRYSLAKYAVAFLRNSPGFRCGDLLQNVAE